MFRASAVLFLFYFFLFFFSDFFLRKYIFNCFEDCFLAAAQVDLASSPLKQLRAAIARKRYILEGDDWLARVAEKYPLPVSNGTGRIKAPIQRWYPELCRSESMDTNLSSSLSSDGIAEEMPISKWIRRRQQALSAAPAVIPVNSLPAYLLCIPSSDAHQLNIRRSQQSKIGQYFR